MNKNFTFDLRRGAELNLNKDSDGAYLISSVDDLKTLAAYVNAGNNCEGLTFKQTQDITFTEADGNFTPIGWYNYNNWTGYYFNGAFDGCNYKISNLKISGGGDDQGLFGDVDSSGTVRNVNLVNANVSGNEYVGTLVGYNDGGTVENCTSTTGTVSGNYYVGGLVGENYDGTVSGSMVDGVTVSGKTCVGGIVGYNYDEGTVENCTSTTGTVSGENGVGGIVGYNEEGTVSGSMVDGGSVTGTNYVGSFVGYNYEGNFDNCLLDGGSVTGTNYVGSFVGYNDYGSVTGYYHNINFTGEGTATELFTITLPENVTATGGVPITFGKKTFYAKDTTLTLSITNPTIQDNATYKLVSETYTVTKDEVNPNIYISVDGGEYSNAVADISVIGGDSSETLSNTAANVTLDGGKGNDSLVGSDNTDVFIYSGGTDSINSFTATDDTIRLAEGFSVSGNLQVDGDDLAINFADGGKLIIEGAANLNSIDLYDVDGSKHQTMYVESFILNKTNPAKAKVATVESAYGDFGKQNDDRTEIYAKLTNIVALKEDSTLIGNSNDNTIVIEDGIKNVLTGGLGKDTFTFRDGGGIITDFGIGATDADDVTSPSANNYDHTDPTTYAHGVGDVKVSGKINGVYFKQGNDTANDATFTAVISYNDGKENQIIVLDNIVKKTAQAGSYQTNDDAAKTLRIWDSTNRRSALTVAKLKNLFYDYDELEQTKQDKVEELTALIKPATGIVTPADSQTPSVGLRSTQIAFNSNKSKN